MYMQIVCQMKRNKKWNLFNIDIIMGISITDTHFSGAINVPMAPDFLTFVLFLMEIILTTNFN